MKHGTAIALISLTLPILAAPVDWSTGVVYQYDGSGNVKQIGTDAYLYDTAHRLIRGSIAGEQHNYAYDSFGNRTGCTPAVGGNCQLGITIDSSTNRIADRSYDARGNMLQLPEGSTFTYDEVGMIKKETGSTRVAYSIYTADDERIAVYDTNAQATSHSWRWTVRGLDQQLLREFTSGASTGTGNFQWFKDHIWRDSLLLASRQLESAGNVSTYHYHVDHLGTPRQVTNNSAQIVGKHDYFPFGVEYTFGNQNEPQTQTLKFTGHERDGALDYMHARHYEPVAGRFLSVDPALGDPTQPQSWNRYTYARNSPLMFTDPTGELIDVSGLTTAQRASLIDGLNKFTGNTYDVNKNGHLVLVSAGTDSSSIATSFLDSLISSASTYDVAATTRPGESWYNAAQNRIELDFQAFDGADYGDVDPRTFNLGSTAIHEWKHQVTGLVDSQNGQLNGPAPPRRGWTGPVVDSVNAMRWERGLPLRMDYAQRGVRPAGFLGLFGVGTPRAAMRFYDPKTGRVREVIRNDP